MSPVARRWRRTDSPSEPGQHHVEHDEIRLVRREPCQRFVTVTGLVDPQPIALEVARDHLADHRFVVHDEHVESRRGQVHVGSVRVVGPMGPESRHGVSQLLMTSRPPVESRRSRSLPCLHPSCPPSNRHRPSCGSPFLPPRPQEP